MRDGDEVQRAKKQAKAILDQLRPMLEMQHEMESEICDGEWSEYRLARRFFQETGINPIDQEGISAIVFHGFIRDILKERGKELHVSTAEATRMLDVSRKTLYDHARQCGVKQAAHGKWSKADIIRIKIWSESR